MDMDITFVQLKSSFNSIPISYLRPGDPKLGPENVMHYAPFLLSNTAINRKVLTLRMSQRIYNKLINNNLNYSSWII